MTISEEEIAARKEASIKRYQAIRAERDKQKEEKKAASLWLVENKIDLFYFDMSYLPVSKRHRDTAPVTAACQITGVDHKSVDIEVVYTVMSPKDSFDRGEARKHLANRLRGKEESNYRFATTLPRSVVKKNNVFRESIKLEIKNEILSRPEDAPQWLTAGVHREIELYGTWSSSY